MWSQKEYIIPISFYLTTYRKSLAHLIVSQASKGNLMGRGK